VNLGKLVGYVILSLVDALLPPVFAIAIVFLVVPVELWELLFPYVVALGGLVFVSSLVVGLLSLRRGGKPFPLTRGFRRIFEWVVRWVWF
jgi:hypothetical protein